MKKKKQLNSEREGSILINNALNLRKESERSSVAAGVCYYWIINEALLALVGHCAQLQMRPIVSFSPVKLEGGGALWRTPPSVRP